MSPLEELKDIVSNGIALDIYDAEEVLSLLDFIGTNADALNKATFGQFFGTIQRYLNRQLILSVARLYERPKKQYKIRSLRTALALLEQHGGSLRIPEKPNLLKALISLGLPAEFFSKLSDQELTEQVVAHFSVRFPDANEKSALDLDQALHATKTLRDKHIAHPEAVTWDELPKPTYLELKQLIKVAKDFVAAIGFGYTSTVYSTDGIDNYLLTSDAQMASRCLKRMVKKLDIAV